MFGAYHAHMLFVHMSMAKFMVMHGTYILSVPPPEPTSKASTRLEDKFVVFDPAPETGGHRNW